jgi:hypothetical protein
MCWQVYSINYFCIMFPLSLCRFTLGNKGPVAMNYTWQVVMEKLGTLGTNHAAAAATTVTAASTNGEGAGAGAESSTGGPRSHVTFATTTEGLPTHRPDTAEQRRPMTGTERGVGVEREGRRERSTGGEIQEREEGRGKCGWIRPGARERGGDIVPWVDWGV